MEIFGKNINFFSIQDISKPMPEQADVRRIIQKPQQQVYRIRQDIAKWRSAVTSAENIFNPQRYSLYQLYSDVVLDAHLTACIQQRKNLTLSSSFCVVGKDGEKNEEKTKLIQTKWFREVLDHSLDSLFWGYSLIQFDSLVNDEFKDIDIVPRIYVKPEFNLVVPTWASLDGINYTEQPYSDWCMGVGKKRDLGLLMKATPLVLWKKNALGAWSVFQDAFGTPLVIGKTDSRDAETRLSMENTVKSLSTGLSAVMDTSDDVTFLETTKQDAHQVFNELIERCNSELSKLILGQTSTTSEKSFVGSAEVHERVLMQYAEMDEYFITGVLNYQLIPLLNNLGFGLDGFKIEVEENEDLSSTEKMNIDKELMKFYDLDETYILETYGTPVVKKEAPVDKGLSNFQNKLNDLYS